MEFIKKIIIRLQLVTSMAIMIYAFFITSYFSLAPWDAAILVPIVGTWQRTLNDMVESTMGITTLLIIITLMVTIPVWRTLRKRRDAAFRLIIANLIALFLGAIIMTGAYNLNNWIFPLGNEIYNSVGGYYRSVIPLVTLALIYIGWNTELRSIANKQPAEKAKAKNDSLDVATSRLQDQKMPSTSIHHQESVASKDTMAS